MPVNPYDDRKVSLRRPHGSGDLDIVRASYTRRKVNVTEALVINVYFCGYSSSFILADPSSRRPSVRLYIHTFKHEYLTITSVLSKAVMRHCVMG